MCKILWEFLGTTKSGHVPSGQRRWAFQSGSRVSPWIGQYLVNAFPYQRFTSPLFLAFQSIQLSTHKGPFKKTNTLGWPQNTGFELEVNIPQFSSWVKLQIVYTFIIITLTIDKNDWAWALIVDEKNESFFRHKYNFLIILISRNFNVVLQKQSWRIHILFAREYSLFLKAVFYEKVIREAIKLNIFSFSESSMLTFLTNTP